MGANLLITKGNEELVYAQAGMADREAEKPIERNTIFRLYSMTKPITAVAAMILMERGMLDLYEPVADILPAFARQKVERDGKLYTPERPILMHDLLAMTSGLVYPEEQTMGGRAVTKVFEEACARLESDHPVSTQEMAEKIAACPLVFAPGTSWQYVGKPAAGNVAVDRTGRVYLCKFYAEMCGT